MNRKQLNEDIGQVLQHLSGALYAESMKGARSFLVRAEKQLEETLGKMQGKDEPI